MTAHITRRPLARRDVIAAAKSIARDNPVAADDFIYAVRTTETNLLESPGTGTPRAFSHPALAGTRSHTVTGFRKYLIFYRSKDDGIEIIRVLHGARDLAAILGDEA